MSTPVQPIVMPLRWSEDRPADDSVRYDHCFADTPFGRFLLTWKSWKSEPWQDLQLVFDETPWGEVWCTGWDTPEGARKAAQEEFDRRTKASLEA
jgi:hypothetical protein